MVEIVTADATDLPPGQPVYLCHICNNAGKWGAGFTAALDRRWPHVGDKYRAWFAGDAAAAGGAMYFGMGQVQFVEVGPGQVVANMVAQRGVRSAANPVPLVFPALEAAVEIVSWRAKKAGAVLRMPRIGCGLAGGTWERVGPLIFDVCRRVGVRAVVCDPPSGGDDAKVRKAGPRRKAVTDSQVEEADRP